MIENIYTIVSVLGAVQGTWISCFFLVKKSHVSYKYFGLFLLFFSIGLLESQLQTYLDYNSNHILVIFVGFTSFLYGPLLFLFIVSLYRKIKVREICKHLLPFLLGFCTNVLLVIILDQHKLEELVAWIEIPLYEIFFVYTLIYTAMAVFHLTMYCKKNKEACWVRTFLACLAAIYWCSFITSNLILFGIKEAQIIYLLNQFAMMLLVYMIAHKLFVEPAFIHNLQNKDSLTGNEPKDKDPRYCRSGLTRENLQKHIASLKEHMATTKPYLDKNLSIHELALRIKISKNHLTQILNEGLSRNFYEFINDYRIDEVKRLLLDENYTHLTINAIGLMAGFNSKTGFNTNFKKSTGMTPTEWKQKIVSMNHLPS